MSSLALRRNRRTHFIPQLGEKWNGVCEVLSSIDVASYPLFMSLTWRYEWPLRTAEKLFWHDQVLMVRTCACDELSRATQQENNRVGYMCETGGTVGEGSKSKI